MDWIKQNKLILIILSVFLFNIAGFLMSGIIFDKIADRVIEKLQKDYSPAKPPYGPGINPDVISDNAFKHPTIWQQSWKED